MVLDDTARETVKDSIQPTTRSSVEEYSSTGEVVPYCLAKIDDPRSKELYYLIYDAVQSGESKVRYGEELSLNQISQAIEAYKNDHPEVFWLNSSYKYLNMYGTTEVDLEYTMSGSELDYAKQELDNAVEELLSDAPTNGSDYEKELFANNALIKTCVYDKENAQNPDSTGHENDAYGAIVSHKAVCEGYARAFQLLCGRLGVDCVCISGKGNSELHEWNCAKISGEWYQVDVTWNDSDTDEEYNDNRYFNLTDEKMYQDHTPDEYYSNAVDDVDSGNIFVPTCTATQYSYIEQEYVRLTDMNDSEEIINSLARKARDEELYYTIYIDESLDFDSTTYSMTNDGYVAQWIYSANDINGWSPQLRTETSVINDEHSRLYTIELRYEQ